MQSHVLLVNPYIHDFCAYDFWMKPLGLSWIASYLKQHGYNISFIDCLNRYEPRLLQTQGVYKAKGHHDGSGPLPQTIITRPAEYNIPLKRNYYRFGIPLELFQQMLSEIAPPQAILVGSMMTYWYPGVRETVTLLRQKFPKVPIALGGVYSTLCTEHAKKNIGADIVLPGPGEVNVLKWVDSITGQTHNYPADTILPATDLPMPAHEYLSPGSTAVIATSLGCPLHCSYCASKIVQPQFRQRPVDQVVKEIFYLAFHQHIHNTAFYDDALLVDAENHLMPILKAVKEKSLSMRFHTPNGLHSRLITPELALLMIQSKIETLRFSYEQSPVFSPYDNPHIEDADLAHAVECFRRCEQPLGKRIKIDVYVKSWLPGQTIEQILDGFLYVHGLGCYIRMTEYSPVPKTKDFEKTMSLYSMDGNEPLYHNNTTLPYFLGYNDTEHVQPLKHLVNVLNHATDYGVNLTNNIGISRRFMSAIRKIAH